MRTGFEWYVAWRYLRERGRRAGLVPLIVAGAMVLAAIAAFVLAGNTPPLHPADVAAGAVDWNQTYKIAGVVCIALANLIGVFGFLHVIQSFFTTVSSFGVYLGTAALVIVLSVMNGFEQDLRHKILGSNAHVLVTREEGDFTEWRKVRDKIDGIPGVVAHTPYLTSEVVVAVNSNYSGTIIKGIEPRTVGDVTDLERNLEKGTRIDRLWPILPDGGVGEYVSRPPDPMPDAGPDGGDQPIDFSGEQEEPPEEEEGGAVDEEPIDFSGGPRIAATADAGTAGAPPTADGGSLIQVIPLEDADLPPPTIKHRRDPEIDRLDGILVGRELAKTLHMFVDQEVQVISPLGQETPAGLMPRTGRFRVAGRFFSGMYEYDTKYVYVTIPALQRFLALGDEVDGIEIKVTDSENTAPVVAAVGERLGPGYRVQDWKEINRNLFSALKLEKIAMFLVLTIIILVASFSIISNLIMVVVEKAREIAILKSMGAADGSVMWVFMIEGLYIGVIGTVLGLAAGIGTCWALGRFGLPLDPNVYYIDRLPVAMDPYAVAMVAVAGVAISFVATVYPSYIAARLRPVEGLRWE